MLAAVIEVHADGYADRDHDINPASSREVIMTATSGTPAEAPPEGLRKCERPSCPVRFVPRHSKHIYCSALCKKRFLAYAHVLRR
jgi:hypothetical protein